MSPSDNFKHFDDVQSSRQQNVHQPDNIDAEKSLSRRSVCIGIAKAAVVLTHFGILGSLAAKAFAADPCDLSDACPGGMPDQDMCQSPEDINDRCPGEISTASGPDKCELLGKDECNTGKPEADKCFDTDPDSDKCESGTPTDDICSDANPKDYCPSGQAPDDYCPPTGGIAAGDNCPGGGPTINGNVNDTCSPEGGGPTVGDECPKGNHWWGGDEDDCNSTDSDDCGTTTQPLDDDTCYNGTDSSNGAGGDDYCVGDTTFGSDVCIDGSDQQDKCLGLGRGDDSGVEDTCPGGGNAVDKCDSSIPSDDYCLGGEPTSDECSATKPTADADQCPGGGPAVDECPGGAAPEDECTAAGGCAGGDQIGNDPIVDNCNPPEDACTMASPDHAE